MIALFAFIIRRLPPFSETPRRDVSTAHLIKNLT